MEIARLSRPTTRRCPSPTIRVTGSYRLADYLVIKYFCMGGLTD